MDNSNLKHSMNTQIEYAPAFGRLVSHRSFRRISACGLRDSSGDRREGCEIHGGAIQARCHRTELSWAAGRFRSSFQRSFPSDRSRRMDHRSQCSKPAFSISRAWPLCPDSLVCLWRGGSPGRLLPPDVACVAWNRS